MGPALLKPIKITPVSFLRKQSVQGPTPRHLDSVSLRRGKELAFFTNPLPHVTLMSKDHTFRETALHIFQVCSLKTLLPAPKVKGALKKAGMILVLRPPVTERCPERTLGKWGQYMSLKSNLQ